VREGIDTAQPRAIIKVGGSLLREGTDYEEIANRLVPWLDRGAWVVVSAAAGVTDALDRLAHHRQADALSEILHRHTRLAGESLPSSLEGELTDTVQDHGNRTTIVSWGERASAAVLQARLRRIHTRVPIVELTSTGALHGHAAAIVPGFYVRDAEGRIHLLPRGGSDISAVLLARRLGRSEIRLWKEGGGIHASDGASVVREIQGLDLVERLGETIRPLHPAAVRLALRWGIELVLESPAHPALSTRVLTRPPTAVELRPRGLELLREDAPRVEVMDR